MTTQPIAIVGGGPTGLVLALLLAQRNVATIVFDARLLDSAKRERRLLALSRGTLDVLSPLLTLPAMAMAPIRSVIVSSRGEFGRAVLDEADLGARPLGATIRYGDLVSALDAACTAQRCVEQRRPCAVASLAQAADAVSVVLADGSTVRALLVVNAEGASAAHQTEPARRAALIADVEVDRAPSGAAYERFTREGPLALLPLPDTAGATRPMALVWCMTVESAERREHLPDAEFVAELTTALGERGLRIRSTARRMRYPLIEAARDELREHRVVHIGNAAQTLHPVAGQGFNLGVRDCVSLADAVADTLAAGADPVGALAAYERARRADRLAIGALTRSIPDFFATRFAPIAAVRSLGLTLLSIVPNFRADLARLLMFGVRS
jgi:2-octaprenyl-6-methoxyphenol hydroxylase